MPTLNLLKMGHCKASADYYYFLILCLQHHFIFLQHWSVGNIISDKQQKCLITCYSLKNIIRFVLLCNSSSNTLNCLLYNFATPQAVLVFFTNLFYKEIY